jgi:hypothetical protein
MQANQQALNDRFAGRGTTAGGGYNQALMQNMAAGQNAYSQGLAQQQDDYTKAQQAGAGILSNIGTQMGEQAISSRGLDITQQKNLNDLTFGREQLEQQRQNQLRGSLQDFFNSMGQYGNTAFNAPGTQQQFGDLQSAIRQSLGMMPGSGPGGALPPTNAQPPMIGGGAKAANPYAGANPFPTTPGAISNGSYPAPGGGILPVGGTAPQPPPGMAYSTQPMNLGWSAA